MSDMREVQETAVFGERVKLFLESDVGQYVIGRLETELDESVEQLKGVHPWRWRKISQIQERIRSFERFKIWMADAIIEGQQAMKILTGEDE